MSELMDAYGPSPLRQWGRHWGWSLTFGIVAVLVGLAAILMPAATLVAIAILFGAQLIVNSVFMFVGAFAVPRESGWLRALIAVLAVLSFVAGVYLVRHVLLSLAVLALVLGAFWMANGVITLFVAIGQSDLPDRGWAIASGMLSVVAGAFVVVYPRVSLLVLTLALGIWLIVYGAILVVTAIRTRSQMHRVRAQTSRLSPT